MADDDVVDMDVADGDQADDDAVDQDDLEIHSSKVSGANDLPWVEKYRPKNLDEIAYQDEVVRTLKRTLVSGNLPHLLFYGPPGTGKTSTILAAAQELYGPELAKRRVLELNASSERGIDVIRQKVKSFAHIAVSNEKAPGHPCPPFKIIILDEADSMTNDAQSALRRTMERFAKVTRFCIICNYVSRIIDPIASRCAKFRYKPLDTPSMVKRLQFIAANERIKASDETLEALVDVAEGDLRKCITLMQSSQRLVAPGEELTPDLVREVAGVIPTEVIHELVNACRTGSFGSIQKAATDAIAAGFPANQLLSHLAIVVTHDGAIADKHKASICIRIAEADKKLTDGADEFLQLLDVLSNASKALSS